MQKLVLLTNSSKHLDINGGDVEIGRFVDGEISISLNEDVKGKHVYIIGSTPPPSDNMFELLLLIDTVVRKGAKKVTAIIPYFGYARSDREIEPNKVACGISVLKLLRNVGGKNFNIITIDLHSSLLKSYSITPIRNISSVPIMTNHIDRYKDFTIIAPDKGATKNALRFAHQIGNENVVILNKKRITDLKIRMSPTFKDMRKNAVIIDDIVASGNTIIEASKILEKNGVRNIYVIVTHMVYPAGGWEKLSKSPIIKKVFLSNTICPKNDLPSKFEIVSITPIIKNILNTQ